MIQAKTVTIAASGSVSDAAGLGGDYVLVAIEMPDGWTAAALTFQADQAGNGGWKNVYDQYGNEASFAADANRLIPAYPLEWAGINLLRVRSGTSGTPVAQAAERKITLWVRPMQ